MKLLLGLKPPMTALAPKRGNQRRSRQKEVPFLLVPAANVTAIGPETLQKPGPSSLQCTRTFSRPGDRRKEGLMATAAMTTQILLALADGDRSAADRLMPLVYYQAMHRTGNGAGARADR